MGGGGRGRTGGAHVRARDASGDQGRASEPLRPSRTRARPVWFPAQQGDAAGHGAQSARLPAARGDDRAGGALLPWRHQIPGKTQAQRGVSMPTTATTKALTTARVSWVDGALFVAEGGSGHTLTMDGAPDIGGRNLASRPMEVVLMGMGGCTAIDVVSMLKKQRQEIEGVEVSLLAERATDHPMVFTEVKLVYTVRGRKLNKALVERAVSLSDEKYCSATAMIKKSAKVSHEVVLVEV